MKFINIAFMAISFVLSISDADVIHFTKSDTLPPVVFIPGDGGCMVEARVNMKSSKNDCPKQRDWFRIWLNLEELLPSKLPCQVEILKLLFDGKTNTSYSPEGVDIRIPGFGGTHTVEYIDDSWEAYVLGKVGDYAHELVQALTAHGLVRNVSIRGAPYDFRLSMASQKSYFDRLRQLVENTYATNNNAKVALVTHSMGGLYTTWFLNNQPQQWKDKFVDSMIALSTPWGGSSESFQAIISGFTFHHSIILNPLVTRMEQRTWESNFLLLPNPKLWPNTELVLTDSRNYTANRKDVSAMFNKIGVPTDIFNYVRDFNDPKNLSGILPAHPGVKTYCIYGTDVPTNHILDYRGKNFPDETPEMVTVPGDGTVSHPSLSLCRNWNLQKDEIIEISSASHNDVLQGDKGINAVIEILQNRQQDTFEKLKF